MDYKELFKKYWFVGVIGIALIVFVGIYASDAYKNRELTVSSKQVDGKYVVYSVDDENVFADDFYNSLYTENGLNCEYVSFQRAVLNKSYETTDDMNEIAGNYAAYMYQTYGEDYINDQLISMGYVGGVNDLSNYYIDSQKHNLLISDYIKDNSNLSKSFIDANNPRIIYHILIKVADITSTQNEDQTMTHVANPTEEETKKLNDVLEALKTQAFQEVAQQYSDDGSAQNGGYIGCLSNINSANYVPEFSSTALSLGNDEVSEVITSQYGYHIIWNAGSSIDTLLENSDFLQQVIDTNPTVPMKAIMDKANELGFEIVDQNLQTFINGQLESEAAQ